MPEGPEIKRVADELNAALKGKKVNHLYFAFDHLKHYSKKFQSARLLDITSRSKAIISRFDNGLSIYSHNQLYGRWITLPDGKYPRSSRSLRLAIHTDNKMALLYSASDIEIIKTSRLEQHPYIKKLGPELLSSSTHIDEIIARFHDTKFHKRQLMGLLQDQHFISGMGNYLCCEVLHICHIHPNKRLADLNKSQREKLARNCLKLTRQSYKTGGITNRISYAEKRRKQGIPFEDYRFHVYRRKGLPCYQCGTEIIKGKFSGKMGYMCPGCQTE